ncbi:MAG: Rieske 2Fe-2S domain-containing protein [Rhodomicrobium sp.]|nr:Rieske 2Fe-2S domain-containing protein [Rhodomicrobium sp.]
MSGVYAICGENEIPNRRAKAFNLARVDEDGKTSRPWYIFVVNWDKQFFAYVNRCPHERVNLDWERNQFLEQGSKRIMCGKHGSLFDLTTGKCVEGRCVGESLEPVSICIVDGDLCVTGVVLAEDE